MGVDPIDHVSEVLPGIDPQSLDGITHPIIRICQITLLTANRRFLRIRGCTTPSGNDPGSGAEERRNGDPESEAVLETRDLEEH